MSFTTALNQLAALTVPGVVAHYAPDQLPASLKRAHLPALLILPLDLTDDNLFGERGTGLQPVAFPQADQTVSLTVTHLLAIAPVEHPAGYRAHLPALTPLIDAYLTAIAGDPTLGGTLARPARVRVDAGLVTYADVTYIGCAFRHTWALTYAAS